MPPKKCKAGRAPESVQGNPQVRERLMAMFEDGSITPNTTFDDIYDEHPAFQVVQREKFRRFFNTQKRVKIKLSTSIDFYPFRATTNIVESMGAPPACQIDTNAVRDCPDFDAIEVKPDADDLGDEEDAKTERSVVVLTWQPLFTVAPWRDLVTKIDYVSVAIVLPTGVGEQPNDVIVRIEDGNKLRVGVAWPLALADSDRLNRKWISGSGVPKIEAQHTRVMAFANFLEKCQDREGDRITS